MGELQIKKKISKLVSFRLGFEFKPSEIKDKFFNVIIMTYERLENTGAFIVEGFIAQRRELKLRTFSARFSIATQI